MDRITTTQIAATIGGFVLGYFVFAALVSGEMALHRIGAALIIGLIGALAGLNLVEAIFDRQHHHHHHHRPL
jgi:ABC-type proline/glycine betaine transport system permease subunit